MLLEFCGDADYQHVGRDILGGDRAGPDEGAIPDHNPLQGGRADRHRHPASDAGQTAQVGARLNA